MWGSKVQRFLDWGSSHGHIFDVSCIWLFLQFDWRYWQPLELNYEPRILIPWLVGGLTCLFLCCYLADFCQHDCTQNENPRLVNLDLIMRPQLLCLLLCTVFSDCQYTLTYTVCTACVPCATPMRPNHSRICENFSDIIQLTILLFGLVFSIYCSNNL